MFTPTKKLDELADMSHLKLDNIPFFLSAAMSKSMVDRLIATRENLEVGDVALEYYVTDTHDMAVLPAYWNGKELLLKSVKYEPSSAYTVHEFHMEEGLKEIDFVVGKHRSNYPKNRPQVTKPGLLKLRRIDDNSND